MKNTVTASIRFSFKGINHSPSITIELDRYIETTGVLPDLYQLIARENDFDLYSYEYEMMQAQDITFSDPQGLVADFIKDGMLDFTEFKSVFEQQKVLTQLQDIAKEQMQIDNLEQQPDLKEALIQAYRLGKNIGNQE